MVKNKHKTVLSAASSNKKISIFLQRSPPGLSELKLAAEEVTFKGYLNLYLLNLGKTRP